MHRAAVRLGAGGGVARVDGGDSGGCRGCRSRPRRSAHPRRPPAVRAALDADLLAAHAANSLQSLVDGHPLMFKSIATSVTYGIGDVMAQRKKASTGDLDLKRLRNFMLSGIGSGWLWAQWYDFLDARLAATGVGPGVEATFISIFSEQFLWAPLFFGLYFLPFISAINGHSSERVLQDVKTELGPTLWANAKVWTLLNVVIYNAPLPVRSLVSNGGDLLWSAYLSFLVQDECAEGDLECELEKQDISIFLQHSAHPEAVAERELVVVTADVDGKESGSPKDRA